MTLTWVSIFRLGLVQMCLGAVVVLTTSTLNRLMVVELALPAVLPGLLVALHYGIQITRPNWGFMSDQGGGGHRTRFIIGGMAVLGLGAFLASVAIPLFETSFPTGLALSVFAYGLIGLGAGASGTSLLALLATATEPRRRAAAATITWMMMIFGIAVTAASVGAFLDPYSHERLLRIVATVTIGALVLTTLAIFGIERRAVFQPQPAPMRFRDGITEIWAEREARLFTLFVFLSMTAYFMQELILEPYAGLVFNYAPGESTQLSGAQNGGVFLGMLIVGIAATGIRIGTLRTWVVVGCLGSAVSLTIISIIGPTGIPALMPATVALGFFNGVFAVAAVGSMMALAGQGRASREGTRMGLWGAAQAIAAGFGGLLGAAAVDVLRNVTDTPTAFGLVFFVEACVFVAAAAMALRIMETRPEMVVVVPGE
ncbi:MAG: BCD family MFS transporter [Paracoccaceae bacterium]|nr:BCD family MFS transporter [Paracoccaceae bacterium]